MNNLLRNNEMSRNVSAPAPPELLAGIPWEHIAKQNGDTEWQTRLVQSMPENSKGSLPSIEEIEAELGSEES